MSYFCPAITELHFKSAIATGFSITATAADKTLPTVTVPDFGRPILHAYLDFHCHRIENTSINTNKLIAAQVIQVDTATKGSYTTAIDMVDDLIYIDAADALKGIFADLCFPGNTDIAAYAEAAKGATLTVKWVAADADFDGIKFTDVYCVLRVIISNG